MKTIIAISKIVISAIATVSNVISTIVVAVLLSILPHFKASGIWVVIISSLIVAINSLVELFMKEKGGKFLEEELLVDEEAGGLVIEAIVTFVSIIILAYIFKPHFSAPGFTFLWGLLIAPITWIIAAIMQTFDTEKVWSHLKRIGIRIVITFFLLWFVLPRAAGICLIGNLWVIAIVFATIAHFLSVLLTIVLTINNTRLYLGKPEFPTLHALLAKRAKTNGMGWLENIIGALLPLALFTILLVLVFWKLICNPFYTPGALAFCVLLLAGFPEFIYECFIRTDTNPIYPFKNK